MERENVKAYAAVCLIVLIWAGWIILSRFGVQTILTPYDITLLRFGTAAILTLPFSVTYNWKAVKWSQVLLIALGGGFPYTLFSFYGLKTIKAANAGVLVNGMLPVLGLIFTIFWFKEKVSKLKCISVVLLLLANVCMMNAFTSGAEFNSNGVLCMISAACVFSIYMAALKRWKYTMKDVLSFVPILNIGLFLPIWLCTSSEIMHASVSQVLLQMMYQGVVVSILSMVLITYTVQKLGSETMAVFLSYVPVVTAIFAFILLKEVLSLQELIGIIVCSIGLYVYTKGK
jgi:drug/metabolite transporter (DMT)-like permease